MEETNNLSIHTGFPNPATDLNIVPLDIGKLLIKHPVSTFLMNVEGNEWGELGIFSGDIAIIDKSLKPRQSDMVVWWQGADFIISNVSKVPIDCVIWGVVTSVIHRYRR